MERVWIVVIPALLAAAGCLAPSGPPGRTPYEIGRDAAAAEDYATAVVQLTLAVDTAQNTFFTAAYLDRGECHLELAKRATEPAKRHSQWDAALADFDAVISADEESVQPGDRARAFYGRGVLLAEQGQTALAEEAFQSVLSLELSADEAKYELEARRKLGWLYLEGAMEIHAENPPAEEQLASQERYRRAQEQFSRGLQIHPDDENMNLGKGLCLHFRGQDREAIEYLRRSTEISETKGTLNPRGHFYLARALELQKGLQTGALQHYSLAVDQDPERTLTPLYRGLVQVLPVYLGFQDPRFRWFMDRMLAYAGDSETYWESMESLADGLIQDAEASDSPAGEQKALGVFSRALARARIGTPDKIEQAVQDALLLKDSPRFSEYVSRIFPQEPPRPDCLYGKASALLGAGRHEEVERFFRDPVFAALDLSEKESPYYHKAMVLEGRNILESWLTKQGSVPPSSADGKIDRDKTLGRARDSFQLYLDKYAEDPQIRMALGQVQELMESYATAYLSYAMVAKSDTENAEAYRRIVRLHEGRLLPQTDMVQAWELLLAYPGKDATIKDYVRRTRETIQAEVSLYCKFCGRKGGQGDTTCMECGARIGQVARAPDGEPQPAE